MNKQATKNQHRKPPAEQTFSNQNPNLFFSVEIDSLDKTRGNRNLQPALTNSLLYLSKRRSFLGTRLPWSRSEYNLSFHPQSSHFLLLTCWCAITPSLTPLQIVSILILIPILASLSAKLPLLCFFPLPFCYLSFPPFVILRLFVLFLSGSELLD